MSMIEFPKALRDCLFCGCPKANLKVLGNPVFELTHDINTCDRYCTNCGAKAPLKVWDGVDSKCMADNASLTPNEVAKITAFRIDNNPQMSIEL